MGHLVNANAFRLGYSKKWTSSWIEESKLYKQYLQEDFIIFRFIKLFFTQYSIPLFNSTYKRNNRDKKSTKDSGKAFINPNQFVDYTFIFSHVSVSRAHFLGISCYFF